MKAFGFPFVRNLWDELKKIWMGAGVGVLLALTCGCALLLLDFPLAEKCLHLSYDLPFLSRPIVHPEEIILVYMDDASYKELQQPYIGQWDRALHARLLKRLTQEKARAVVFDIVFSDLNTSRPAADLEFERAMRENGKVVLAGDYVPVPSGYGTQSAKMFVAPAKPFEQAAALVGMSQLDQSSDFVVREHLHGWPDASIQSLTWAAAKLVGAKVAANPSAQFDKRWVNYYGPPRTLTSCSYVEAIDPERIPSGFFSNKVIFVGAHLLTYNAGERKDEFRSPYTSRVFTSGVEVHATIFLNLLRNEWLRRLAPAMELAAIIFFGVVFGLGLALLRPLMATGAAIAGGLLVYGLAFLLFWQQRLWFPWMIVVVAQIPIALLWSIVFNSIQLYVQKRLLEQSLALYLSPKRVKQLLRSGGDIKKFLRPGAEKQLLTIIFSDIENFTKIAEGMDSDDLAKVMNNYFETAISHCIHKTDGTVVKYIGDAIFAFWNAPEQQPDHQERACQAALLLRDQVVTFSKNKTTWTMRTRIGLHTGVANVGNFGSTSRIDYTAIGETINLASRMEGLNKFLGTHVLITKDTEAAVADKFVTRFLGNFQLKGFEKTVEVYELIGFLDEASTTQLFREVFAKALNFFQDRNFDAATASFEKVLKMKPEDGPTKFYLARLAEFKEQPPPDHWQGEVELREK